MGELILIGVFAVIFSALVYGFSVKSEKKKKSESVKPPSQRPFQQHTKEYTLSSKNAAVTISHEKNACEAVKAVGHKRYLVREAPILPLKDCTQSTTCNCQYLHHTDRRKISRQHETPETNELNTKLRKPD